MPEVIIKGFECDICSKKYLNEPHNNWNYNLKVTRNNPNVLCFEDDTEYKNVCYQCMSKIYEVIYNLER